jgi:hypothetical protein
VEKRAGTPFPRAATGHVGEGFTSTILSLLGVGLLAAPVIIAAVTTQSAPAAIRLPLLVLGAAAYGLALAWGGALGAAIVAEQKLPELSQVANASKL